MHAGGHVGDADWGVRGRVVRTAFLGNHHRVVVEAAASDEPVQVSLYREHQAFGAQLALDSEVVLWWDPGDAAMIHSVPPA